MAIKNQFDRQLRIEMGDVIHMTEDNSGLDGRFTVYGVEHEIRGDGSGFEHVTRYTCEEWIDHELLVLDDTVRGVLDGDRKLGF